MILTSASFSLCVKTEKREKDENVCFRVLTLLSKSPIKFKTETRFLEAIVILYLKCNKYIFSY
jgi:hypothetical protein